MTCPPTIDAELAEHFRAYYDEIGRKPPARLAVTAAAGRRTALAEALDVLEAQAVEIITDALDPLLKQIIDAAIAQLSPVTAAASFDVLTDVLDAWGVAVDQYVLQFFADTYKAGGLAAVGRLLELGITPRSGKNPPGPALGIPDVSNLMDEAAARHLALARPRFVEIADVAWGHARQQMLLGFEQGHSIDQIERSMREVTDLTRAVARQVARTEVVAAANAGSVKRMELEGDNGAKFKQWLSTLDSRTRPTHVTADGQVVARDDAFVVGGRSMQYPGDPAGGQAETINCRCTILWTDDPGGEIEGVEGRQEGGVLGDIEPDELAVPAFPGEFATSRQAHDWMNANWGGTRPGNAFELSAFDARAANDIAAALDRLLRQYPGVWDRIRAIGDHVPISKAHLPGRSNRMGPNTWGDARPMPAVIRLNRNRMGHGKYESFLEVAERSVAIGFHPEGTGSVTGVVDHEFGHMVFYAAQHKAGRQTVLQAVDRLLDIYVSEAKEAVGPQFSAGITRGTVVRDALSRYAGKNFDELFAEAFSAVRAQGDQASELARDLVSLIEGFL